jgi:hypothetical protein
METESVSWSNSLVAFQIPKGIGHDVLSASTVIMIVMWLSELAIKNTAFQNIPPWLRKMMIDQILGSGHFVIPQASESFGKLQSSQTHHVDS